MEINDSTENNEISEDEQLAAVMDADAARADTGVEEAVNSYLGKHHGGMTETDFQFGSGFGIDWDYLNETYSDNKSAMDALFATEEGKKWKQAWVDAINSKELSDYYTNSLEPYLQTYKDLGYDSPAEALFMSWMYGDESTGTLAHTIDNILSDASTALYTAGGDTYAMDDMLEYIFNETIGYQTDEEGNVYTDADGNPYYDYYVIDVLGDDPDVDQAVNEGDVSTLVSTMKNIIMQNALREAIGVRELGEEGDENLYQWLLDNIAAEEYNDYEALGNMEFGWGDSYEPTSQESLDEDVQYTMAVDPYSYEKSYEEGNTSGATGIPVGYGNTRYAVEYMLNQLSSEHGAKAGHKVSDAAYNYWYGDSESEEEAA